MDPSHLSAPVEIKPVGVVAPFVPLSVLVRDLLHIILHLADTFAPLIPLLPHAVGHYTGVTGLLLHSVRDLLLNLFHLADTFILLVNRVSLVHDILLFTFVSY